MSEWKNFCLGDVVEFNPAEKIVKGTLAKKIAMEKLQPFCRTVTGYEVEKYNGGVKFRNGDTIMARITPCLENGKTARIDVLDDDEIGFGSTEYVVFRAKENVTVPDFVYYLARSEVVREPAIKSMVGTSGRQRVQTDYVRNIVINLPPLDTQKKIAAVLSALDDKIELNNAINRNLEEQAQTIYKNMFVDNFNPAWKSGTLSDIVDVRDGTHDSPKKVDDKFFLITSKHLLPFGVEISLANTISEKDFNKINERSAVNKHDILLSMIGTVGIISFVIESDINFAIKNVGLIKTSEKPQYKYYLLSYLKSNFMRQYIERVLAGTTQKYISLAELRKIPVNFSDSQTLNEYNVRVEPIFLKIAANIQENQKLGELRDVLLPRLMSGEIDVSAVEI